MPAKLLPKKLQGVELSFGLLAFISLLVIYLGENYFERRLEVDPRNYPAKLTANIGELTNFGRWVDKKNRIWRCIDQPLSFDTFCGLVINVADENGVGLDLSAFQSMKVYGSVQENGEGSEYLSVSLRNKNQRYYRPVEESSTKYNTVEVPSNYITESQIIDMAHLRVANWWLTAKRRPVSDARVELDNIIFIEFSFGLEQGLVGKQVNIEKIVWQGPLIAGTLLYRSLAIFWGVAILCFLIVRLFVVSRDLKSIRDTKNELVAINEVLNIQNKQYEALAKSDPLTGLKNRSGVREVLLSGLNSWKELGKPLSFCLIDLDHFKAINDTYGHDVGDKVLKHAARVMEKLMSGEQALARWGGEEFIVVCCNATLEQALGLAEKLRRDIEQSVIDGGVRVTASIGVATLAESDLSALLKRADAALYRAKALGRNRVISENQI